MAQTGERHLLNEILHRNVLVARSCLLISCGLLELRYHPMCVCVCAQPQQRRRLEHRVLQASVLQLIRQETLTDQSDRPCASQLPQLQLLDLEPLGEHV